MSNDPIACNLSAADYQDRVAWIADLNATALRGYRRDGRRVVITYDASAAQRVNEFVRRERQCCPFLEFDIDRRDHEVVLTIEAPAEVADHADVLFAPYAEAAP